MRFVAKQGDLEVSGEAESLFAAAHQLVTAYSHTWRWSVFAPITIETEDGRTWKVDPAAVGRWAANHGLKSRGRAGSARSEAEGGCAGMSPSVPGSKLLGVL